MPSETKDDYDGPSPSSINATLAILRNPQARDQEIVRKAGILAAAIIEEALAEIKSQIKARKEAEKKEDSFSTMLDASMAAHENAAKKAYRYKDALERIASTTSSDDPCREYVDIARVALKDD